MASVAAGTVSSPDAKSITKKCTTTNNGASLPWYYVDSMWVTQSFDSSMGMYQYRVEMPPKRTVTYNPGGGTRYVEHHIDTVKMYDSSGLRKGTSMDWPPRVVTFYSSYWGMDFYMKAHVTDPPYVEIFPTCKVYF